MWWNLSVVDMLAHSLSRPLPGARAHTSMLPSVRSPGALPAMDDATSYRRKAAVLILLVPDDGGALLLPLIQRTDDGGPHGGQIALPGGRVEAFDESITAAALREASEEINVDPQRVRVLGALTPLWIPVSGFEVHAIVGAWEGAPADLHARLSPQAGEVEAIHVVALDELFARVGVERVHARGVELDAPCFATGSLTVWGATAAILAELRALATWATPDDTLTVHPGRASGADAPGSQPACDGGR